MLEIYLDVETTGLDAQKNGIWQLAYIIFKDEEEVLTENRKIAPMPDEVLDPKALSFNRLTEEVVRGFDNPQHCYLDTVDVLDRYIDRYNKQDKAFMYGYNVRFDMEFLRAFFEKNGNKFIGSYFWFPPIDVMNVAADFLKMERSKLINFKQETVARWLGLKVDDQRLHDALYDIELTKQIYDYISSK